MVVQMLQRKEKFLPPVGNQIPIPWPFNPQPSHYTIQIRSHCMT